MHSLMAEGAATRGFHLLDEEEELPILLTLQCVTRAQIVQDEA